MAVLALATPTTVNLAPVALQIAPETALQAYELVGAVLGLFIAYQAYRGYRRNDSRPMLFIALGFALILGIPIPLVAGYYLVGLDAQVGLQAVVQTVELLGLGSILYALRMDPDRDR